jgi:Flp pilus assembly protein TadB
MKGRFRDSLGAAWLLVPVVPLVVVGVPWLLTKAAAATGIAWLTYATVPILILMMSVTQRCLRR